MAKGQDKTLAWVPQVEKSGLSCMYYSTVLPAFQIFYLIFIFTFFMFLMTFFGCLFIFFLQFLKFFGLLQGFLISLSDKTFVP